jgi:hypothetical protein
MFINYTYVGIKLKKISVDEHWLTCLDNFI